MPGLRPPVLVPVTDDHAVDVTRSIQERFEAFHAANPWVLAQLVELAQDWRSHGHRRISIDMLFHVLRWSYGRSTRDDLSTFKLNDHYTSRYVRLVCAEHPELASMFETRCLKAD